LFAWYLYPDVYLCVTKKQYIMKTKKNLTLKKTRITKLSNLKTIKGGDNDPSFEGQQAVADNDSFEGQQV